MVKASRSGSQKAEPDNTQAQKQASPKEQPAAQKAQVNGQSSTATNPKTQPVAQKVQANGQPSTAANPKRGKQSSKGRQHTKIGGTAIVGAKSTQQKELTTTSPANQQAEYYNRDMRRRMEQMGTGPYAERAVADPRERRKKRKEHLQERQERIKQLVNAKGPSRNVRLGRRNTYFLIGIALALVILIAIFVIVRHIY
ncbi:MAG TPA: hypothetical protein VGD98_20320 [Ktedonobacteraceae bacterium]